MVLIKYLIGGMVILLILIGMASNSAAELNVGLRPGEEKFGVNIQIPDLPTNFSVQNVSTSNSSDFWDDLDTPTDFTTVTASGTIQGEQITSTDDATISGDSLIFGSLANTNDKVMNWITTNQDEEIVFDDATGTFTFSSHITSDAIITAEQITSTDDMSLVGNSFSFGSPTDPSDLIFSWTTDTQSETITFDEANGNLTFSSDMICEGDFLAEELTSNNDINMSGSVFRMGDNSPVPRNLIIHFDGDGAANDGNITFDSAVRNVFSFDRAIETSDSISIGVIPSRKLIVEQDGNAYSGGLVVDVSDIPVMIFEETNSNNWGVGLGFGVSTLSSNIGAAIMHIRETSASVGGLHFATKNLLVNGANILIRMTIDRDGNVGIGTLKPTHNFTVFGDVNISGIALTGGLNTSEVINLIGSGRVTNELIFKATNAVRGSSAPTEALRDIGASGGVKDPVIAFSKTIQQDVYGSFHPPDNIDNTVNVQFHLMWIPGDAYTSGDYNWTLEYLIKKEDESYGDANVSLGDPIMISETITPSAVDEYIETEFSTTIDINFQEVLIAHFFREVAIDDGDDVGEVRFFEVQYTQNKLGEET